MQRRFLLCQLIFTLLAITPRIFAAPTTQQDIESLGADDPADRAAAEARLDGAGKGAINLLRQAAADPSPEVRNRALRAQRYIELFSLPNFGDGDVQLALARNYLSANDPKIRKTMLERLFMCQPERNTNAILTRLVPMESDADFRRLMLYRLEKHYRENVARIIYDDNDTPAVLSLLDAAAGMWRQQEVADDAAAMYLTGHLDDLIDRCTAEQANGNAAEQEHAGIQLAFLYRVAGKYDQAMKYARLAKNADLIFLILQDHGDWAAAAAEPDTRWRDPMVTQVFHAAFQRLSGHLEQAVQTMQPLVGSAAHDSDDGFVPSKYFLLNDLPDDGINLLTPRHPAAAFSMRVDRGEIAKALTIADQFEGHPMDGKTLAERATALRQTLGELPEPLPATKPVAPPQVRSADEIAQESGVKALKEKRWTAAADIFGALWSTDRTQFASLYLQGYAMNMSGQDAARGESLMHMAELMPLGDPRSRWKLASGLDAAGLTEAADQQRQLGLRTGGDYDEVGFTDIYGTEADTAMTQKQWARAADRLDRLCLINLSNQLVWDDPRHLLHIPARAHLARARAARERGDLPATMAELHAYQQYLPISSEMVIEWAPLLDQMGEHAKADELFFSVYEKLDAICKKYPRSRMYLNDLAWMSACTGRRLHEALIAAQAAVDLKPDDYQMMDTLAEVRFRLGDRAGAIALETHAASLSSDPYLQRQLTRFTKSPVPSTTQPGPAPE